MLTSRFPILIAIDDTEYADAVLQHGLDQAARHDAPDIHVLRVVQKGEGDLDHERQWLENAVVEALEATGLIDYVNITFGSCRAPHKIIGAMHEPAGYELPTSEVVAKVASVPTLVTGRFRTLAEADEVIRNGLLLAGVDPWWQGTFVGAFIILAVVVEKLRGRRA